MNRLQDGRDTEFGDVLVNRPAKETGPIVSRFILNGLQLHDRRARLALGGSLSRPRQLIIVLRRDVVINAASAGTNAIDVEFGRKFYFAVARTVLISLVITDGHALGTDLIR